MTPWSPPAGDGECSLAALIAATAGGMALVVWSQRTPPGDAGIDAALAFAAAVAATAAAAGTAAFVRRRRAVRDGVGARGREGRPHGW